jgi:hypothetical protein
MRTTGDISKGRSQELAPCPAADGTCASTPCRAWRRHLAPGHQRSHGHRSLCNYALSRLGSQKGFHESRLLAPAYAGTWLITLQAQNYTLGNRSLPGRSQGEFRARPCASIAPPIETWRLHRPAYHSSSYDYNLTAQLFTDGIKETSPAALDFHLQQRNGVFPKNEREYLLDGNWVPAAST